MTLITRMERIRELFKIKANKILSFERDGNYAKVKQEFIRDDNARWISEQSFFAVHAQNFTNYLEYSFLQPLLFLQSPNRWIYGNTPAVSWDWKQNENLCPYAKFKNPLLKTLKQSFLKSSCHSGWAGSTMAESLYQGKNQN